MINYIYIFEKINEAKNSNYNIIELQKIAWKVYFSENEVLIEDEILFYNTFSELLYYFDIEAIDDKNLKEIIDDLVLYSNQFTLNRYDILFILNKKDIIKTLEKFKSEIISFNILNNQLKKYLKLNNFNDIKTLLSKFLLDIT